MPSKSSNIYLPGKPEEVSAIFENILTIRTVGLYWLGIHQAPPKRVFGGEPAGEGTL